MPESLPAVVVGECSLTFTFAPEASDGIPVTQMDSRDIYFLFLPRLKSLEEKGLKLINRLVTTCERDAACLFSYPLKPGTCICFEGILQAYLPQNSTGRPLSERFLSEVHVTAGIRTGRQTRCLPSRACSKSPFLGCCSRFFLEVRVQGFARA